MTYFHLLRTQKHKMLSIVVLNMAKYTIISLILTDLVPICFIFKLFRQNFRGSFRFKICPKSQVDFRGVIPTLNRFPSFPNFQFGKLPLCIFCYSPRVIHLLYSPCVMHFLLFTWCFSVVKLKVFLPISMASERVKTV